MTDHDLIAALLTRCGMIMEDVSAIAIIRAEPAKVADQIATVKRAAADIILLAEAASVLARCGD